MRMFGLLLIGSGFALFSAAGVLDTANELYAASRFPEAIAGYQRALESGANPAVAYYNLGNSYYQLDSVTAAIVCYESAIREAPTFAKALLNVGTLYYRMDALGEAVAVLERAREQDESNPQVLLLLASAYARLHSYHRAVPLLEQVLAVDSSCNECFFMLFDIYRVLGDFVAARRWLERYPDSGKRVADKYQQIGELVLSQSGAKEAVFYFQRMVDVAPDRRNGHYRLVEALFESGSALSAVWQARASLAVFQDFAELALMAGNRAYDATLYSAAEQLYLDAYRLGRAGGLVGLRNLKQRYQLRGNSIAAARINALLAETTR